MLHTSMLMHILLLFFMSFDINFSNFMLAVIEFTNFPFFLVAVQSEIIFFHQLSLSALLSYQGLDKSNFVVEKNEVFRLVILEYSNLGDQLLELVIQGLLFLR